MFQILSILPALLRFVFLIAVIVFLLGRRKVHRRPANYAIAAITISLSIGIISVVVQMVCVRYMSSESIGITFGVLNLVSTLASMGVFGLLLAAVFIDRDGQVGPGYPEYEGGGNPLATQPNENPYASPRQ